MHGDDEPRMFDARCRPRPQPRVRVTRRGHAYTPDTADEWRAAVADAGEPVRPCAPLSGALRVSIALRLPRPGPRSQAGAQAEPVAKTTGDVDNYAKAILDALTAAGWWHDDAQVCDLRVTKRWAGPGEHVGALVSVGRA